MREPIDPVKIEAVNYPGIGRAWYTRLTERDGRVIHYGPWLSEWAARQLAKILAIKYSRRHT